MSTDFSSDELKELQRFEVEQGLPSNLCGLFGVRDGAALFKERLPRFFSPASVADEASSGYRTWDNIAQIYRTKGRFHQAIAIFAALYDHMLFAQQKSGRRFHKASPLVWMFECCEALGYALIARRYLMLILIEDAISDKGIIRPEKGVYFRAVWRAGLPDADVRRYAKEAWRFSKKKPKDAFYPERVLQELDKDWAPPPSPSEMGLFPGNPRYIGHLIGRLGEGTGKMLELLADYLLSCMPGCRTAPNQRSRTHQYDVVCSMEGPQLDFRSEFGRYFICECKDWGKKKADVRTMAVLCRGLDSVKARFGVLFSKSGISGAGSGDNAEREQLKIFQDRGTVIVVIDAEDLSQLAEGANFVTMLRRKYERVRMDLGGRKAGKIAKP